MMKLALLVTALLFTSPAIADVSRCMAMAFIRTGDIQGRFAVKDSETVGPVKSIERKKAETVLCDERAYCYPAKDFDFITPCSVAEMQPGKVILK